ncbi:RNA polymerase sigma factor [Olivibacter domesticus]|uniref:RNA polymerase sigma-70 factor, ECF subfamily n=1 Tax=Olivibacter domesticus TaxID=407022 RepID=A0A1H7IE36_OLID1|nr:RNA polymerase sigma-70 factor [Olivibacter domesticus]SEK59770.1 RNA polymerase sigma-70 factor, ECF subfamily [Olivibacter domesticus]
MKGYRLLTDAALTERMIVQDHRAFKEIYDRYWSILYRHALHMLRDDEQAADVVQDIFANLWDKAAMLKISNSLSSFLYASVRNRIFDLIDREKVKHKYLAFSMASFDVEKCEADELIRERQLRQAIEEEVNRLPAKMREIFVLSRYAHLSYQEIADQIQISEGTVRKQIHNALRILRLKLGSLFFLLIIYALLFINRVL